jgi:hypothetical protein
VLVHRLPKLHEVFLGPVRVEEVSSIKNMKITSYSRMFSSYLLQIKVGNDLKDYQTCPQHRARQDVLGSRHLGKKKIISELQATALYCTTFV